METLARPADLHLHPRPRRGGPALRLPGRPCVAATAQYNILLRGPEERLYIDPLRSQPSPEGIGADRPARGLKPYGHRHLAGLEGENQRAGTMNVAVVARLGVVELSGMRWRATTLMPLDPHDHGPTSRLRVRSATPGSGHRVPAAHGEAVCGHPQCEAVLECG
jgi:hypothetical protein